VSLAARARDVESNRRRARPRHTIAPHDRAGDLAPRPPVVDRAGRRGRAGFGAALPTGERRPERRCYAPVA